MRETAARPWRRFGSKNPKARAAYTPTHQHQGHTNTGVKGGGIVTLCRLRFNDQCWHRIASRIFGEISYPQAG